MYSIDKDVKDKIIASLLEYHENATLIYNIFEKLYQENKIKDVTVLDVLQFKAEENRIYKPLPMWFMDIINIDYDTFYNYILDLDIINLGEDFIILGYDEYYCIRDIVNLVERG